MRFALSLQQSLSVYSQSEMKSELFRRLSAEDHTVKKYLEIVHYRAEFGVDGKGQIDLGSLVVYAQIRVCYGVVYPISTVRTRLRRTSDLSASMSAAAAALTGTPVPSS